MRKLQGLSQILTIGDQDGHVGHFLEENYLTSVTEGIWQKNQIYVEKLSVLWKKIELTSESKIVWQHSVQYPCSAGQRWCRTVPMHPSDCHYWLHKLNSSAEPVVTLWFSLCTTSLGRKGHSGPPGKTA